MKAKGPFLSPHESQIKVSSTYQFRAHFFILRLFRIHFTSHSSRMGTWRRIWIADYVGIEEIREKLGSKHGIDIDDFIAHTKVNKELLGEEDYSEEHGLRTVIKIKLSNGRKVIAFIDSVDREYDIWAIRSARYMD